MWGWGKKRKLEHPLDAALLHWTQYDPFRVRNLLNGGLLILGRSGGAKTSSSGRTLMQAIVNDRNSGGLLLAAKVEDEHDIKTVFEKAGRLDDLIIFSADSGLGFNFLDYVGKGEVRNVVQCLMTIGQSLKRGEGKGTEDSAFWDALNERLLYNAVAALKCAGEPMDRILPFLMTAATSKEEQRSEGWHRGYHNRVMEAAAACSKSPMEEHDWQLCMEFWVKEYPYMDSKTRSNGLAGVMNILHTFHTGLVRHMVSQHTNCSPDDILKGSWVLVNFPPSTWGEVGAFICAGWKYLTQYAILKRKAEDGDPFCVIWCDEAHLFVSDPQDSHFIAQCRSHRGCLVYLTQSVSSFYAAMKGEAGKHQADSLLANFSTVIIHASDPVTAKWASAKLGRKRQMLFSGSIQPNHDMNIWEQCFGQNRASSSFSEHYENVLQDDAFFMAHTGGPANKFIADCVILRSGEPFSSGENYLRTSFSQRG